MPRTKLKNRGKPAKSTKRLTSPPPVRTTTPPTPMQTPSSPSLFSSLAHGMSSGVGWGVGTGLVRSVFGGGGASSAEPERTPQPATLIDDDGVVCKRLQRAYNDCVLQSDVYACDSMRETMDKLCPSNTLGPPTKDTIHTLTNAPYV
jgi:hypothetical protein